MNPRYFGWFFIWFQLELQQTLYFTFYAFSLNTDVFYWNYKHNCCLYYVSGKNGGIISFKGGKKILSEIYVDLLLNILREIQVISLCKSCEVFHVNYELFGIFMMRGNFQLNFHECTEFFQEFWSFLTGKFKECLWKFYHTSTNLRSCLNNL
jgi:hypothetical protein